MSKGFVNISDKQIKPLQLMLKENDSFLRLFIDDDSVDEVTDGFQRFVGKKCVFHGCV